MFCLTDQTVIIQTVNLEQQVLTAYLADAQIIHNELKNYVRARGVLKVIMILQERWKGDLMVLSFNLIT